MFLEKFLRQSNAVTTLRSRKQITRPEAPDDSHPSSSTPIGTPKVVEVENEVEEEKEREKIDLKNLAMIEEENERICHPSIPYP